MKSSGLKNEEQLSRIMVSGSASLRKKSESGINLFDDSDLTDGIIYGRLIKPKYNDAELVKSLDTVIIELIPPQVPELPDTVLRVVYNQATQSINELTSQNLELQTEINGLNSKISNLELVTQSLLINLDNEALQAKLAKDRADAANSQLGTIIVDLQNAIQNSINEAIERVSLSARNEALFRENELLKDQLFGKEARIAEGARAGEDFSVRVLSIEDNTKPNALIYRQRANGELKKWINGPKLELSNFTSNEVTLTFKISDTSLVSVPTAKTIAPNSKIEINFDNLKNNQWISDKAPKNEIGLIGDKTYTGTLTISSPNSTLDVTLILQKQRGGSFG